MRLGTLQRDFRRGVILLSANQPLPTVLGYGMGGCRSGGERVGAGHTRPFPRSEWCRRTLGRRLIPPPCSGCLLGSSLWSQSMPVTVLEGATSGTCQTAVEGAAKQSDEANYSVLIYSSVGGNYCTVALENNTMIGAGGRIRRIRRSAPIATRRKKYRGYQESKLRIVGHLRMKGGQSKCANSSDPWRLDHATTENGL